jgi:lipoyl synthase
MNDPVRQQRLPPWFKVSLGCGETYRTVRNILASQNLHTVCSSARCPNAGECWSAGTATFMILGDTCTRNCAFCAVQHGIPDKLDPSEPGRVRRAVTALELSYVVITSVTRDDLDDGGASVFADVIYELKRHIPGVSVEVLVPDFLGRNKAVSCLMEAEPDILNHNIETVPSLYSSVRPQADYARSLKLLEKTAVHLGTHRTKSGVMVGLGETRNELKTLFRDLSSRGVGRLTVGQYLQPTRNHLPVQRYVTPKEFDEIRHEALEFGFVSVASGPLVRSSYHAAEQAEDSGHRSSL